jgi:hypothetical protein
MRDFKETQNERPEFRASFGVDHDLQRSWKYNTTNITLKRLLISYPTILVFICLIVGTQVGLRFWQLSLDT